MSEGESEGRGTESLVFIEKIVEGSSEVIGEIHFLAHWFYRFIRNEEIPREMKGRNLIYY